MKKRRPTRIITYIGVLLLAFFILAPLVWLVISSVIPEEAILKFPPAWFGLGITNDNYVYIFTGQIPQSHLTSGQMRTMISQEVRLVPRAIGNSLLVAGGVMIINLIAGSLAAYAYARLRFPARRTTFFFITLSRLIPPVALAVPYYTIVQKLGLLDTYWSLIAVYSVLTLPFSVLILTLYFRGIPREIEEAAEIDGCDPFQIQRIPVRPAHHHVDQDAYAAGHPGLGVLEPGCHLEPAECQYRPGPDPDHAAGGAGLALYGHGPGGGRISLKDLLV
jgi:multiple sugar transport system permease protein